MYGKFEAEIEKLNQRVEEQACGRPGARLLMTHPGVGPVTALATEVFLGDPARFADSKALASYVGMIPREYSSGERQRLGRLSKQGNPLLRFLWGEAGAHAARRDPELQRFYRRISPERSGEGELGRGSQTGDPAVDHVAGSDRIPRVLSSWTEAAEER
jgi:transposase